MSNDARNDDEAFGERIGRALRGSERFGDEFEANLVDAIQADRPIVRRVAPRTRPLAPAWWAAPMTLRVSPLAGLAMAASLAAIVSVSTLRLAPTQTPALVAAQAVHDTV